MELARQRPEPSPRGARAWDNASAWLADTFVPSTPDRLGRNTTRVSVDTFDRQFAVDARGSAALIAEFARRHAARHATWGRIIGLTS